MIGKIVLLLIAAWICIVSFRELRHAISNYKYHNNWLRKQMGIETTGAGNRLFMWAMALTASVLLFGFAVCIILNV